MLRWVHVAISTLLIAVNFADYLLHQRVFQDDVSEALMVHCLEHCVLIGSVQAEYVEQVKPEIFKLVGGEVDQLEVLGDADHHLIESEGTLGVLLNILWVVRVSFSRCLTNTAAQ